MGNADSFDRTIYHRENIGAATDTPILTLAERARLVTLAMSTVNGNPKGLPVLRADRPNGLLVTFGATDIEIACYGVGNDGGTFNLHVVGLPAKMDRLPASSDLTLLEEPSSPVPEGPRLILLAKVACTLGTSTEANLNPITAEVVAATTFRAVDTMVLTTEGSGYQLWDAAGTNGASRLLIDPIGCPKLFCYADSFVNVTRVDIQARRMTSFH